MFDEFVKQFKRVFSSKCNGGKLVYNLPDRLHSYKQILLATSIILLLGYSQFREHFHCQGTDRVDQKVLTNFCWINGTTTVNRVPVNGADGRNERQRPKLSKASILANNPTIELPTGSSILDQIVPHVGIHFRLNEHKYELINHNYMRSLWALLLMMIVCSYVASRMWANIFSDNTLKTLLKLPGSEELAAVKKAQALKPYQELMRQQQQQQPGTSLVLDQPCSDLSSSSDSSVYDGNANDGCKSASNRQQQQQQMLSLRDVFGDQVGLEFVAKMNMLVGDENDYNHTLDYYPNQLIYLLMPINNTAYRLTKLRLRRQLLTYSLWSFLLTLMQFLLPLAFIGPKYLWYGWNYACLALKHISEQILVHPRAALTNSWDYELSSSIWPISTQCEYKHFGLQGMERIIVQCTVPINEICSKLFAIIWWFVAVNIVIEYGLFLRMLICSVNFATIQWTFGRLFWPRARRQAKLINRFRYRHANVFARAKAEAAERRMAKQELRHQQLFDSGSNGQNTNTNPGANSSSSEGPKQITANDVVQHLQKQYQRQQVVSPREQKRLEAERAPLSLSRANSRQSLAFTTRCQPWWSRDVSLLFGSSNKRKEEQQFAGQHSTIINLPALGGGGAGDDDDGGHTFKDTYSSNSGTFCEQEHDQDLYYLLYLLYLRLDCSRKKVEQVIQMTSEALSRYLDQLDRPGRAAPLAGPTSSSTTTSTTIVPASMVAATTPTAAAPATPATATAAAAAGAP